MNIKTEYDGENITKCNCLSQNLRLKLFSSKIFGRFKLSRRYVITIVLNSFIVYFSPWFICFFFAPSCMRWMLHLCFISISCGHLTSRKWQKSKHFIDFFEGKNVFSFSFAISFSEFYLFPMALRCTIACTIFVTCFMYVCWVYTITCINFWTQIKHFVVKTHNWRSLNSQMNTMPYMLDANKQTNIFFVSMEMNLWFLVWGNRESISVFFFEYAMLYW